MTITTSNYLKERLKKWLIDDDSIIKITASLNNIPYACQRSSGLIKEHLDLDDNLQKVLKQISLKNNIDNSMNIVENNGVAVYENNGNIILNSHDFNNSIKRLHSRAIQCLENNQKEEAICHLNRILNDYDAKDADTWWMLFKIKYYNFQSNYMGYYSIIREIDIQDNDQYWKQIELDNCYKNAIKYANVEQKEKYYKEFIDFKNKSISYYKYYVGNIKYGNLESMNGLYERNNHYCKILSYSNQYFIIEISKYSYYIKKIIFKKGLFYYGNEYVDYCSTGSDNFYIYNAHEERYYSSKNILGELKRTLCNRPIPWNYGCSIFLDVFWKRANLIKNDELINKNTNMIYLLNPFENDWIFYQAIDITVNDERQLY